MISVPGFPSGAVAAVPGCETFQLRLGRCYELACLFGLGAHGIDDPGDWCTVTHGSIQQPPLPRLPHAWVELKQGGTMMVLDLVTDHLMTWREFKSWAKAKRCRTYTLTELAALVTEHDNAGPWHTEPYGVKFYDELDDLEADRLRSMRGIHRTDTLAASWQPAD